MTLPLEDGVGSEALRRVYDKFSCMSRAFQEIEEGLDTRYGNGPRRPDLSLATLDEVIRKEGSVKEVSGNS